MIRKISAAWLFACTAYGQTTSTVPERVSVPAEKSYTGKPFEYTRGLREQNQKLAVYDIRYPSPVASPHESNNTVPAELYVPAGVTWEEA